MAENLDTSDRVDGAVFNFLGHHQGVPCVVKSATKDEPDEAVWPFCSDACRNSQVYARSWKVALKARRLRSLQVYYSMHDCTDLRCVFCGLPVYHRHYRRRPR